MYTAERLIYIEVFQLYPIYTSWNIEETKWKKMIPLRLDRSKYRWQAYKAYQLDVWLLIGVQGRPVFDLVLMSFENVLNYWRNLENKNLESKNLENIKSRSKKSRKHKISNGNLEKIFSVQIQKWNFKKRKFKIYFINFLGRKCEKMSSNLTINASVWDVFDYCWFIFFHLSSLTIFDIST